MVLGILGVLLFRRYYEIVFIGFIVDLIYGFESAFMQGMAGLLISAILLVTFSRIKEMIR